VPIEDRPCVVNERSRLGDIEVDLMTGKNNIELITTLDKLEGKDSKIIQQLAVVGLRQ